MSAILVALAFVIGVAEGSCPNGKNFAEIIGFIAAGLFISLFMAFKIGCIAKYDAKPWLNFPYLTTLDAALCVFILFFVDSFAKGHFFTLAA